MSENMNRRRFLKVTGATGAGLGIMGSSSMVLGKVLPSSRISVAVMGVNSRGSRLASGLARHPGAEVTYICDVDDQAIKKGLDAVREAGQQRTPHGVKDFRRALEDPGLDALVISAPIHWHAPAAILALKAGKHVYVEKPCSHNPREGELLVQAADLYGKVVQMGNQRRSWYNVREAVNRLHEGIVGRPYFARCWYASRRGSIGTGRHAAVPSHLDYDLWQGPAPRRPYRDNLIHYNWHWFWHWGAGELLNNGTHFIDLARWGLQVDWPLRVTSNGGRYHWKDDQQTPDTQVVAYDFPGDKSALWEARSCNPKRMEGSSTGITFYGTEGSITIDGNGYTIHDFDNNEVERVRADSARPLDTTGPGFDLDRDHLTDFMESIRDGRKPVSDIRDANISVHICHLGNIAQRTGQVVMCDVQTGRLLNRGEEFSRLWTRSYEPGWEPVV